MKFIRYGITFRRIQREDIEKVRQWRNSKAIRQKMIYRKYITQKMQEKWFSGIEKSYHHSYYIIHFEGKDIGLLNQKNFRVPGKMKESGIFIVNDNYKTSYIPVIASLIMWFLLINILFISRHLEKKDNNLLITRKERRKMVRIIDDKGNIIGCWQDKAQFCSQCLWAKSKSNPCEIKQEKWKLIEQQDYDYDIPPRTHSPEVSYDN